MGYSVSLRHNKLISCDTRDEEKSQRDGECSRTGDKEDDGKEVRTNGVSVHVTLTRDRQLVPAELELCARRVQHTIVEEDGVWQKALRLLHQFFFVTGGTLGNRLCHEAVDGVSDIAAQFHLFLL